MDPRSAVGAFWQTPDTTEYVDWSQVRRVTLPNLRPSTTTISLRLPQGLLDVLRVLAKDYGLARSARWLQPL